MTIINGSPIDKLLTAALVLAPALLLLSSIIGTVGGGIGESAPSALTMHLAFVFFALVALKLTSLLADRPALAALLLLVAVLGVAGGIGYGVNAWGIDAGGVDLNEASTLGGVAIKAFGICFPISMIGFGVALATTHQVPTPVALGVALGGLLFPMGRISGTTGLVFACDVVLLLALTAVLMTSADRASLVHGEQRPDRLASTVDA